MQTVIGKTTHRFKVHGLPILLFAIPIIICVIVFKLLNIQPVRGDYDPNWGVLAINTNKSYYEPGEQAQLEFAVLDISGRMDCEARLNLDVYKEDNLITSLSLDNGIVKNPDCKYKETAVKPDYEANYTFNEVGTYNLVLTAKTKQGVKQITKVIEVKEDININIERETFTRIFPKKVYEVSIISNPNVSLKGEVVEYVPSVFDIKKSVLYDIYPYSDSQNMIIWNVDWNKDSTYTLSYEYKAPESSPEFFELGPLEIKKDNNIIQNVLGLNRKTIFKETSSWHIAVDDLVVHYSTNCTASGPKTWAPDTAAAGAPDLGSTASLSSFNATNSATADISDSPDMQCNSFSVRDLGSFTSANVVFSYAQAGANNDDDYLDVNYSVGATEYDLTTIIQDSTEKSNNTNGGYWSYSAPNITSWNDISNTAIHFNGVKVLKGDKHLGYVDAVWVEVTYTPRTYIQNDFEWYAPQGSVTLTNIWPTGNGDNLTENEVFIQFPASNEALEVGDQIRLQMNFTVGAANLPTTIEAFKLQYVAADDCTTASGWSDVGAKASGTIWRLYDEASLADAVTQVNQISTSDSGTEGYFSETVSTSDNPNAVNSTQNTEWDWPLENNGAAGNTTYCFRMAVDDEVVTFAYNSDSYPKLTTAPGASDLMRHGNIFQGDVERGFFWAN